MSQLNQCILEANLLEGFLSEDGKSYTMKAASSNLYGRVKAVTYFDVEVCGRMAEVCLEQYRTGRGIRVVGYLRSDEGGRVYILAEHIDWLPFKEAENAGEPL